MEQEFIILKEYMTFTPGLNVVRVSRSSPWSIGKEKEEKLTNNAIANTKRRKGQKVICKTLQRQLKNVKHVRSVNSVSDKFVKRTSSETITSTCKRVAMT
jgi:hypothetical protein